MADVLKKICDIRLERAKAAEAARPFAAVDAAAKAADKPRGFRAALEAKAKSGYGLIAEIKKASPSAGLIRPDFDPAALARAYAAGGAACLSVLTEVDHFQGHDDYLRQARGAVDLPVLRKDFMLTPYQIAESRALGADCILVIMAALADSQARELEDAARSYGIDVLVEVHDEDEMERALHALKSPLLGINNRNLKTLKTDLAVTERLALLVPKDGLGGKTLVAESGLSGPADLARMARAGARCFLVGESLMRQADVTAATKALLAPVGAAA
jgi:indole-3-glycerol phosphate synthase